MSTGAVTNIVVGVAIVALLVTRQVQTRPVNERSAVHLVLVLVVIGVVEIVSATKGHAIGAATIAWLLGELLLGAALGAVRALTVKVWRVEDGAPWRKGTRSRLSSDSSRLAPTS
jgi:hypothetical protein